MNSDSLQAVRILDAHASSYHRLRAYAYSHYIRESYAQKRVKTWSSSNVVGGGPPGNGRTTSLLIGSYVQLINGRSIIWGIAFSWNANQWTVEPDIEIEFQDDTKDSISISFPKKHATTIDECIRHLATATDELINYPIFDDPRLFADNS